MPTTLANISNNDPGATSTSPTSKGSVAQSDSDEKKTVRLHITPFNPALSKIYLPPSLLPLAQNISYHSVETFPEKGFGYVELPVMEAQKLKKKLNGSTLKGSKVRIEDAKPEKRKVSEDVSEVKDEEERPKKRSKKAKKENGVLDGTELPDDRKVKRGWTEPPTKNKKEKREKKSKDKEKGKEKKPRKESKYTKDPELLFKAKLTPVAAAEVSAKEKKDKKKEKKKSKAAKEVVVHEFEKNIKQPSFLKQTAVSTEKKPAVEYINGQGWVDEDGNVVEAEIGKVRNRRLLELVDPMPAKSTSEKQQSSTPSPKSSPAPRSSKKEKKPITKAASPLGASEPEDEASSVVSSLSSEEESDSDSDSEADPEVEANNSASSPAQASKGNTPEISLTPSSPVTKEVHPLEAIFKRAKPSLSLGLDATSTPGKGLAPINTSFSFFENNNSTSPTGESMEVDGDTAENLPATPYTQRDLEWRGLRSAAPTPDTAAVGRRFSFPWRNGSQEVDEDEDEDEEEEESDNEGKLEAVKELSSNTKANASTASHLPLVAEENEDEDAVAVAGGGAGGRKASEDEAEVPESEFKKWFWENQGSVNRAWKKGRRGTMKSKRLTDNKKAVGGGRRAD
ncbi:unnamed protein product [Periconia digitata]|uniref:Uncharacterized protein n=1 Tax=Periconia digitata TaxID=1303443 RepID=A0A9W4UT11_9PLEO|nr:unnamed protein product [Periconia digitata]